MTTETYFFVISDVNECDEATSNCDQTCNNTIGGFECGCFDGYNYNASTSTCDESKFNPFPHIDAFWRLCRRRLLKT